jgi:hypothetical protein
MEVIAEMALATPIQKVTSFGAVQLIVIAAALIFKFSLTRLGKQTARGISKAVRCEKRTVEYAHKR